MQHPNAPLERKWLLLQLTSEGKEEAGEMGKEMERKRWTLDTVLVTNT